MPFTAPAFLAKLATVRPAAWPSGLQARSSQTSSASRSGIVRFKAILLGVSGDRDGPLKYLQRRPDASSEHASGTQ